MDDLQRVIHAMQDADPNTFFTPEQARAAMAATREIDAADLRDRLSKAKSDRERQAAAIIAPTVDWLTQRAKEIEHGK